MKKIFISFILSISNLLGQETHWGGPPPNVIKPFSFILELRLVGNGQYGYVGKYSWHNMTNQHYKIFVSDNHKDWFEIANVTNNTTLYPLILDYSFNRYRYNGLTNISNVDRYRLQPLPN